MSTNKKALFFDIDGTILSEVTGKIPESASAALQKAHDLGHLLFINTGRTICCLPPMICQLPFRNHPAGKSGKCRTASRGKRGLLPFLPYYPVCKAGGNLPLSRHTGTDQRTLY